jgi:hypothetical protein
MMYLCLLKISLISLYIYGLETETGYEIIVSFLIPIDFEWTNVYKIHRDLDSFLIHVTCL